MTDEATAVDSYYQHIMQLGSLRTPAHAVRVNEAVLRALGFNLSRGVRRDLGKALPAELGRELTRGWRLIHFRNRNITFRQFAQSVARMSGNTDPQHAEHVMSVVFSQLKRLVDDDLVREVARDLSPELRSVWTSA